MFPYCEHDWHSLPLEFVESPLLEVFQSHLGRVWAASFRQPCFSPPAGGQMTSRTPFQPQPLRIISVIQYPCAFQSWKKEITLSDTSLLSSFRKKPWCLMLRAPAHIQSTAECNKRLCGANSPLSQTCTWGLTHKSALRSCTTLVSTKGEQDFTCTTSWALTSQSEPRCAPGCDMESSSLPEAAAMSQENQNWKENQPSCRKTFFSGSSDLRKKASFPFQATYMQSYITYQREMPFTIGLYKYQVSKCLYIPESV